MILYITGGNRLCADDSYGWQIAGLNILAFEARKWRHGEPFLTTGVLAPERVNSLPSRERAHGTRGSLFLTCTQPRVPLFHHSPGPQHWHHMYVLVSARAKLGRAHVRETRTSAADERLEPIGHSTTSWLCSAMEIEAALRTRAIRKGSGMQRRRFKAA